MSINDLKKAFDLIEQNIDEIDCTWGTGKSNEFIQAAEKALEVNFPKSYIYFIEKHGFGGVGSHIISGIRADKAEEVDFTGVVWKNKKNQKDFSYPKHLIMIESLGDGSDYCLDTSQMNEEGECPVIVWPIEGYEQTPVLEVIAEDFGKFFLNMVEKEISKKKQEMHRET